MLSLAETQRRVRDAVVIGDAHLVARLLVGGRDPAKRLAVHHRHYEASLVTALLGKFPATAWLVGTPLLDQIARRFVREHPPVAPCIAEYGGDFPPFLATRPETARLPYLRQFAELEWSVGLVSIAVDRPAVLFDQMLAGGIGALPDATLALQPGLRYHRFAWPVDDLMTCYLAQRAPERFVLEPADVAVEIRGARGALSIDRLEVGDLVFRQSVQEGQSIGRAAERALDVSAEFEPGRALTALVTEGLVIATGRS